MKNIVFDFDKTLCVGNSIDHIIKAWGIDPDQFFEECDAIANGEDGFGPEYSYLHELTRHGRNEISRRLDDSRMRAWGRAVPLYKGLKPSGNDPGAFRRLKAAGANIFIVSGGLQSIIEGCLFRNGLHKTVTKLFATRMTEENPEDGYGPRLNFPKRVITAALKVPTIFSIAKGTWRPEYKKGGEWNREQPFEDICYVGDGWSDMNAFAAVKRFGGYPIAVYDSNREGSYEFAEKLLNDKKVFEIANADYTRGSKLMKLLEEFTR